MKDKSLHLKAGLLAAVAFASMSQPALAQTKTNVNALKKFATSSSKAEKKTREQTAKLAKVIGIPVREVDSNGVIREIYKFVNGTPLYRCTTNLGAANTIGTSKLWPGGIMGLDLDGSGMTVCEWDGGNIRTTHQEFGGRVTNKDGDVFEDHPTHVCGTISAAGVVAAAHGMANKINVSSYEWNDDASEMATEAAGGLLLSNHSYGLWSDLNWMYFGQYEAESVSRDQLAYDAPYYTIIQAAGNSGDVVTGRYDSLIIPASAKNVLTIGAVVKNTYNGPDSVPMSHFSSWGPTDDGRIKPDIVTPGVSIFSSLSTSDSDYASWDGTSMASPVATGSLSLVVQHYGRTFPGLNMRSATLKALAIHTADEAGTADGPDYAFGWGQLNTPAMVSLITDSVGNSGIIQEGVLNEGVPFEYSTTSDGGLPIRVTLVWTDPPGTPSDAENNNTPRLVNDLDLRVEVNGTVYKPWVLDPTHPSAPATKGDNTLDNVEQVVVPASAGTVKVTVSHKGQALRPSGTQAYSLIVTGLTTPKLTGMTITPARVQGGQTALGEVTLDGSAPAGGMKVTLASSDRAFLRCPDSITVPAGLAKAKFSVKTVKVTEVKTGTITATMGEKSFSQDVAVVPIGLVRLTLNPTAVDGGQTVDGEVEISLPAPTGGAVVRVATDNKKVADVAWAVYIPEGETVSTFTITTFPVTKASTVRIRAAYPGPTKYASLTVNPPFALSSVALSPSTIKGGNTVTGTITMAKPATSDTVVNLTSSIPSAASVPATVTVLAGSSTATFTVTTYPVTSSKNPVISAKYGSVTKTAKLKVNK